MWFTFIHLIKIFKAFIKGRGFYPTLMVIVTWSFSIILFLVLIYEIFLYLFKVKYDNPEFKKASKKLNTKKDK
ncbi:hypothetical protein CLAUR_046550 (plasmid) [Clostridium felsineum]|nr:hypothetical protein CLAUR_046550 [Clostridium felsineum]URZ18702.1 hypothetical protein CLFE_047900 [Clostridium felsineum DSM 794]